MIEIERLNLMSQGEAEVDNNESTPVTERQLTDMTLAELWELFPIVLVPYAPQWAQWAVEEIELLSQLLAEYSPVVSHIGSTAIPTIWAKPIIDILVELAPSCDWSVVKECLEHSGYICMASSASRMSFNKGYTPHGYADRVFHVHLHCLGDNDELLFRDYLLTHPDEAKAYETLKRSLLPRYRTDRDSYTDAKSDFVRRIVGKAKTSG